MSKKLGSILVLLVAGGLMLYSMSRTFHLLSATLPAGQEILAAVALLGFDLGLVAWLIVFLKGAEGGAQRAIAMLMILVDLVAVIAGFMGDTLLVSGQQGLLEALDVSSRQTIVLITAAAIAANICGAVFFHMMSPENLRRMTEEQARDKIQSQALAAIAQQANILAEELAPVIAADWVRNMRADFSAALVAPEDVKKLPSAKPDEKPAQLASAKPSRLESFKAAFAKQDAPMATMASDAPGLPANWKQMDRDAQDEWALNRWLRERFPHNTFKITMQPFNVRVNEDGADLKAVQNCVDDWFSHAYGTKVQWGEAVEVETAQPAAKRGRPAKKR